MKFNSVLLPNKLPNNKGRFVCKKYFVRNIKH